MKFTTGIRHGFGIVLPDGAYRFETDPFIARCTPGMTYMVCEVGGLAIAVFLDRELTGGDQATLSSNRPSWLHALIFARTMPEIPNVAVFEIEVVGGIAAEAAAIATACVSVNEGAAPQPLFRVDVAGHGVVELTMEFDWETERWEGEVTRR